MAIKKTQPKQTPQPFGRVLGLLAGCLMTAVGIWNGLTPETILLRALMVAAMTGIGVRMVTAAMLTVFAEEDD